MFVPILLFCLLTSLAAGGEAASLHRLDHDVRITLRNGEGKRTGDLLINAGMEVERLDADGDEDGKATLRYVGQEFTMPVGAALHEALTRLNPSGVAEADVVFDADQWERLCRKDRMLEEKTAELARGELRWPGPGKYRVRQNLPEIAPPPFDEVPEDFAWDQTVVMPGRFVFLKLPFIKQTYPGICVAASSINVVAHFDPDFHLTARELFRVYTPRSAGAALSEGAFGMRQFGIESRRVSTRAMSWQKLVEHVEKSLERNLPLLAADPRHVVLIYGYDREREKLFVWNQWGNGKVINGMPKGTYELQYSDLPIEFGDLIFVNPVKFEPSLDLQTWLQASIGNFEGLRVHPITGVSSRKQLARYLDRAGPELLKSALRSGRTILIPTPDHGVISIEAQPLENDYQRLRVTWLPSGRSETMSLAQLSAKCVESDGEFYTVAADSAPEALTMKQ